MKLKTQILVAVASASVLLMLLPGYADRTRPKLSSSTAKTSKHSNSDLSAEQTSSNRIAETSLWQDVTTPLVSGINHENHRGSAWCDYDNDGFVNVMDFLYLLERWRNVCVESDLNFNAIVNIGDSHIVIGVCCKCNN